MVAITDYQNLDIWKDSMQLCKQVYTITSKLPTDERFGLQSQMRRAAVSVPSNIAEGFVRKHAGDFRRFLSIALGSLAELNTQLLLTEELHLFSKEQLCDLFDKVSFLSRRITKFYKGIK